MGLEDPGGGKDWSAHEPWGRWPVPSCAPTVTKSERGVCRERVRPWSGQNQTWAVLQKARRGKEGSSEYKAIKTISLQEKSHKTGK